MKKKIVGIVILMLLATTVVSATNINGKEQIQTIESRKTLYCTDKITPIEPTIFDFGVDQKQTEDCGWGYVLLPGVQFAQGFTPTKNTLTAVSLYLCNINYLSSDPIVITVAIRETLDGADLITTTRSVNKDTISNATLKWLIFDFDDISTTAGSQYFMICSANRGTEQAFYMWVFNDEDLYTGGEAWRKENATAPWVRPPADGDPKLEDFCFKTYFKKPFDLVLQKNIESLIHLICGSLFTRLSVFLKTRPLIG